MALKTLGAALLAPLVSASALVEEPYGIAFLDTGTPGRGVGAEARDRTQTLGAYATATSVDMPDARGIAAAAR